MNELEIFSDALELSDPQARSQFLDEACRAGSVQRMRIEALLRNAAQGSHYLESPLADLQATAVLPATESAILERPGSRIGFYKLLQQIGEGGMGVVWMAEQTAPVQRKVALKVIKPGMDTRQVIARFEAERQALALMDHVNIARVFDGGATVEGRPYFVMELVHGVPITKYCDDNHLTLRQRLELFVPVCQAIQHAHQKGIIHRDIKPSNVMVTLYDGQPVPKVFDFGVAKATEQKLTERTLFTQYGTMVGTLEYMSPEQAELSALGVDTRSDIYSLGVLLYELLTGTTPLCRKKVKEVAYAELLRMIREEEPQSPSTRLSTSGAALASISAQRKMEPAKLTKLVRGELDWIVMKALDKDRNRRYDTANGLAQDVEHYLRDEPVTACPPSAWYSFQKFARRNKRGLATAAVAILAVMVTAAISGGLIWQANQNLRQSLKREQRGAYFERIALAEREWAENNLGRMEQLLEDCPSDLRDWEWHYLKRLRYGAPAPLHHESTVYGATFSSDGHLLATATQDGYVRLYQAKTGQELRRWKAHEDNATCVQFSPDDRWLASAGWDAKVRMWDVQQAVAGATLAPLFELEHIDRTRVWSVAFSPSGERLATAGGRTADQKGAVKVWNLKQREATLTLTNFTDRVSCVRFSPDGRQLATACPLSVSIWDAETGREMVKLEDACESSQEVAFSPDGRLIATAAGNIAVDINQAVKLWDARTGKQVLSFRGHVGGLRAVAFSPDGRRLASAGLDQTVKMWDTQTGQETLTLRGHLDNVFCLAFSPDGRQLVSGSLDKSARIWDASPIDGERGLEYVTLLGHQGPVTDVAFHPKDGRVLATAGTDGTVRLWDFRSGKLLVTLPGEPDAVKLQVAFSPDGRRLVVCTGRSAHVHVWDVVAAKKIASLFQEQGGWVLDVAYSPNGQYIATVGFDFAVRVWDATTFKQVKIQADNEWVLQGVKFSPDGTQIAWCGADSTVGVWDWQADGQRILEPQHAARVAHVTFSSDGQRLASASWDRTIKVWDRANWQLLHDLHDPTGAIQCVEFGPKQQLVWGSTDGTVKVCRELGAEPHILRAHTSWVQSVDVSPSGEWIASASLDGSAKVWKMPADASPSASIPEAIKD
jgi:WD40 repeat protein/serine/threonine protein kinase